MDGFKRVVVRGDGGVEVVVEFGEGPVARELYDRLPFEANARVGEGEILLPIPVPRATEPADNMPIETGHVAYRPTGNALCLLFDAADEDGGEPLTRVGTIVEGAESCRGVRSNQTLRVEAAVG